MTEQFRSAEAASNCLKSPPATVVRWSFAPVRKHLAMCALEISRALKETSRLHVRMGIHSGPVSGVVD